MNFENYNNLSAFLDNVYQNTVNDSATCKTLVSIKGEKLCIECRLIYKMNRRDNVLNQTRVRRDEAMQMVAQRKKELEKVYKKNTGKGLDIKKVGDQDINETLTVSPYSDVSLLKYRYIEYYEVK